MEMIATTPTNCNLLLMLLVLVLLALKGRAVGIVGGGGPQVEIGLLVLLVLLLPLLKVVPCCSQGDVQTIAVVSFGLLARSPSSARVPLRLQIGGQGIARWNSHCLSMFYIWM